MREKEVEQYLRDKVKELGGRAFKFVSPGNDGVPDRLVVLPGNRVFFVETKAPGKTSTPLQKKQQERLRALGCFVFTDVDSKAAVDHLMLSLRAYGLFPKRQAVNNELLDKAGME